MNPKQAVFDIHSALIVGFNVLEGEDRQYNNTDNLYQIDAVKGWSLQSSDILISKSLLGEDCWIPREVWLHALDGLSAMWWSVMCEIVGDPIEGIDQETHDKFVESINHLRHQWRYSL